LYFNFLLPLVVNKKYSFHGTVCRRLFGLHYTCRYKQEAQLSQRGRANRIIEYFAKSLKVTQGHRKWCHPKAGCGFLFAFYGRILHRFRDEARYWSKITTVRVGILPQRSVRKKN